VRVDVLPQEDGIISTAIIDSNETGVIEIERIKYSAPNRKSEYSFNVTTGDSLYRFAINTDGDFYIVCATLGNDKTWWRHKHEFYIGPSVQTKGIPVVNYHNNGRSSPTKQQLELVYQLPKVATLLYETMDNLRH